MATVPVLPLLRGDYVAWTDIHKVERFRRQCAPGSLVEAWYTTLTPAQTATWSDLETVFLIHWPPALPLQLTAAQKKERLKAVVLKEAEIGTMLDDEKGQEWGHVRWARQVQWLAQSFGDNNCQFLDVVLHGTPDLFAFRVTRMFYVRTGNHTIAPSCQLSPSTDRTTGDQMALNHVQHGGMCHQRAKPASYPIHCSAVRSNGTYELLRSRRNVQHLPGYVHGVAL
ncbi:hypothetical protein C8R48DRAFT_674023 [Suillus tomentosus]|nr:hypothetical protein C8R48DRAFT_674023 [Suillus tomentosus]